MAFTETHMICSDEHYATLKIKRMSYFIIYIQTRIFSRQTEVKYPKMDIDTEKVLKVETRVN